MVMGMSLGCSSSFVARSHAQPRAVARVVAKRSSVRARAEEEGKQKGVFPGLNQWPPKGFTEHGDPKPEDDPKNYDVISGERKGGPSQAEVDKAKQKEIDDLPFSKPNQEGGTQRGGGGEGMSS